MKTIIPYSHVNPVIYDNDDHRDVYTDEYLMALASAGEITLNGIITSYPHDCMDYEAFCAGRAEIIAKARRSGMRNIPDAVKGPCVALNPPRSGNVDDTVPIGTEGSMLIVREAKKASLQCPLVVLMGGPLTSVADAYLLDKTIAARVIVAALCGTDRDMNGWNGNLDPWACNIVINRFTYVQFPESDFLKFAPQVPKIRLFELPDTELRQWMLNKCHPTNQGPWECDADGQAAIALMRMDYCIACRRVIFDCFEEGVPTFKENPIGNGMVVTHSNQQAGTDEFFRAMKNPKAYGCLG